MEQPDPVNQDACLQHIRFLIETQQIRVSRHAQEEMDNEDFDVQDALFALKEGQILENYPAHRRGPCCLVAGMALDRQPMHVVCTTVGRPLVLITVYEPKLPKWLTPHQRRI